MILFIMLKFIDAIAEIHHGILEALQKVNLNIGSIDERLKRI